MNQEANAAPAPAEQIAAAQPFVLCEGLVRIYKTLDLEVMALQGLELSVAAGEIIAVIGSSGSGKSTLLNILGAIDEPSAGRAEVGGWNLARLSPRDKVRYRAEAVGFVWQNVSRNLVPYLTALENVELPMILSGRWERKWARELLEIVGLKDRMHHRPGQMSGGQQQRVAIAISLANKPKLLLADEPTGSLDSQTASQIFQVFHDIRAQLGITLIVVTHDRKLANQVDRYVQIRDGKVTTETVRRTRSDIRTWEEEEEGAHEEYVVLDAAGRLQIPLEYRQKMGISKRAKIFMRDKEIVIQQKD